MATFPEASTDIPADYLRALRTSNRVTLVEIARRCGVTKQTVWLMERPGRFVRAGTAARYLAALSSAIADRQVRTHALLDRGPLDGGPAS